MPVNRVQLMDELYMKLANDSEAYDETVEVAEMVKFHWQGIAPQPGEQYAPGKGGFATGAYRDSIEREAIRGRYPKGSRDAAGRARGGQFLYHHRVVTYSPIAHFLEYGTAADHDPETSKGNWYDLQGVHHFSWKTPTPRFAIAAQVALDFGGTPD